ncbi:uncharacterized protein LOC110101165 [Dendrobium catenatum]|uniref:uncharacterized protein LOC110101165 n=1 Tax=Dendrobium catenatum TaxID=906689 RepID=UPI00109F5070|nr:uncharacterized protein LOC110101165 [Dendrobium catenatum]
MERNCLLEDWPEVHQVLEEEDNRLLNSEFLIEEIEKSITDTTGFTSPGEDGITYSFIKNYWPISLCNTIYKIASKVILNRMKAIIQKIITVEQAAFDKGRSLQDHALIAQELFHKFRISKDSKGLVSIKLDMEQAYDSMGWPTLQKDVFGIRVSKNGPKISHLLYADDIIFFAEAKLKNMKTIKKIVTRYCEWTGRNVNSNKSGILFGKAVNSRKKRKIKRIMGYKEVKEINYLGSKLTLRRLSRVDFQFLLDKTVILALPSFYSTISLVPKADRRDIEKHCRRFIWDKSNEVHGLHYLSWEKLCEPIDNGGRDLQSCSNKLGPLRAKLAWKYMKDEESLLHKTLYPIYGSCWEVVNGNKSISAAWKIIKDGSKFLKNIVRWDIANVNSIDVFEDTWILDKCLNRWPTFVNPLEANGKLTVDYFISGSYWNLNKLYKFFGNELVRLICHTEIKSELINDNFDLIHMESGRTISSMAANINSSSNSVQSHWSWLKKSKVNARVENFCWRMFNNALPTFSFLSYRRLQTSSYCPRGCQEEENICHLICRCQKLVEIFKILDTWGFHITDFNNKEEVFEWLFRQNHFMSSLLCNVIYLNWKERNELVHGKKGKSSMFIAIEAISFLRALKTPNFIKSGRLGSNQHMLFEDRWCPPPPEWIKLNVDATLFPSYKGGIGGVIRDFKGRLIAAFGKPEIHWDITHLELLAITSGKDILKDWMHGYKCIIIESHNINIINLIHKKKEAKAGFTRVMEDCLLVTSDDWNVPPWKGIASTTSGKAYLEKAPRNYNSALVIREPNLEKVAVVADLVFRRCIPLHLVATELRRQWMKFSKFHLTSLGSDWVLCSFFSKEAMENVLLGGPWFVNGYIVGLDKWSSEFNPNSLKVLSSPIWITMSSLLLYCWDEINVSRIASSIEEPILIDGDMFQWGRRKFARICVRIQLDRQLPTSVRVEGVNGKFFQKVEYEKISNFFMNVDVLAI